MPDYFLTETHPPLGFKGKVVDEAVVNSTIWFQRALYEVLPEECEFEFEVIYQQDKNSDAFERYMVLNEPDLQKLIKLLRFDPYLAEIYAMVSAIKKSVVVGFDNRRLTVKTIEPCVE